MNTMYLPRFPTLKDLDIRGKKVFMRIDINVPVDPDKSTILEDRRIKIHSYYIKKIMEEYSPALILGSHQSRPGSPDFVTLEKHHELLQKYTGLDIKFVNDVMGPVALNSIKNLKPGEVLLLDNLRLISEEIIEAPPEKQSSSILAKRLASVVDVYVNEAFATAHRSHPSIVGLPLLLPSAIGPLFEKEANALRRIISEPEPPRVYVLGGRKVVDHLRIIDNLVKNKLADRILTCGLLGLFFLAAKGVNIGFENYNLLEESNLTQYITIAKSLLLRGAPIETPVDLKTKIGDKVENEYIGQIKGVAMDIGEHTAEIYSELIKDARTVVMRGPAGVIELEEFRAGTLKLMDAAIKSSGFVLVAGGHLGEMFKQNQGNGKIHVSSGGNSVLLFLSGEELPAFRALELSAKMFLGW